MPEPKVFPSLLACDFARLGEEAVSVIEAGADGLHYDVMDAHFVDNLTIGPSVLADLRRFLDRDPRTAARKVHLDVHLMIEDPARYADAFLDAGADALTVHIEVLDDPRPLLRRIRGRGRRAGLAIRPDTAGERLLPYLEDIDLALPMTVQPGWGGQGYIEAMEETIARVRREGPPGLDVEVDGGINDRTAARAAAAGANLMVAGTFVFKAKDRRAAVDAIRSAVGRGRPGDSACNVRAGR